MEIKKIPLQIRNTSFKQLSIGSGCVIFQNQKVLLVRGKGGDKWKFPGGHVDDQESIRQTADRECQEEINCQVELYGKPFIFLFQPDQQLDIILIHYQAKIISGTPQPTTEIAETKWFDCNNLNVDTHPNVPLALKHFAP